MHTCIHAHTHARAHTQTTHTHTHTPSAEYVVLACLRWVSIVDDFVHAVAPRLAVWWHANAPGCLGRCDVVRQVWRPSVAEVAPPSLDSCWKASDNQCCHRLSPLQRLPKREINQTSCKFSQSNPNLLFNRPTVTSITFLTPPPPPLSPLSMTLVWLRGGVCTLCSGSACRGVYPTHALIFSHTGPCTSSSPILIICRTPSFCFPF